MADIYVATTGNDSTGTGSSGNPYATPGKAAGVASAGDTIFVKYGTYTLTTSTPNVAGGPCQPPGNDGSPTYVVGYDTTATLANTDANRPTLSAGATGSVTLFAGTQYTAQFFRNLIADANGQSSVIGFHMGGSDGGPICYRCKATGCASGFKYGTADACEAASCGTYGFELAKSAVACLAGACAVGYFNCVSLSACIAKASTSHGFELSFGPNSPYTTVNCVAYANGGDGFKADGFSRGVTWQNCLAVANAGYGFRRGTTSQGGLWLNYCAAYNNTSGATTNLTSGANSLNFVTLTGDPFTNAGSGDFSLNNTAGAGAACRAAGYPGVFPGGLTTGYADIGAVQHADAGGGGGTGAGIFNGRVLQ